MTLWTVARQPPLFRDFSGKNTGGGCHFLLQGIFLIQGLNLRLLRLLRLLSWQADSLPVEPPSGKNAWCHSWRKSGQEVVPELPSEGQTAVSQESGVSSGLGVSICYSGEWGVGTRVGGNGRTQRVAWAQPLCRGVMEGC